MKLGIIGAMDVEVATLKEKMGNCTQRELQGLYSGRGPFPACLWWWFSAVWVR